MSKVLNLCRSAEVITFDDVSLLPQYSTVASRDDVDLSCGGHFGLHMKLPIISANMASVTESVMCEAMDNEGALGILHRFNKLPMCLPCGNFGVSVGVDDYIDRLKYYNDSGVKILCVDVAHGHHQKVARLLRYTRDMYGDFFKIIAGNVCTPEGAKFLHENGADVIKVGVGPGSFCSTRLATGHGVPQFTAIGLCRDILPPDVGIIADGGIKNAGDIAKALSIGADYVMLGRLLAGCKEASSRAISTPNGIKKIYMGSASFEFQSKLNKKSIMVEGVHGEIPYVGSVKDVLTDLSNGLRSACSYSGASSLEEFKKKSVLLRVTKSSFDEGATRL